MLRSGATEAEGAEFDVYRDPLLKDTDVVRHMPTGAKFFGTPGSKDIIGHEPWQLGSVLPDGTDYDEESVWRMARQVMEERLKFDLK